MPQPGPMTSRPRSRAAALERDLVGSTETWSENRKTCMPAVSARCASRAAYSPGTEISATLAPVEPGAAAPSERAAAAAAAPRAGASPPAPGASSPLGRVERALGRAVRRRRPRSRCRPGRRRAARRARQRARGSPACPSRSRTPRTPSLPRTRLRDAASAARCRRSGRADADDQLTPPPPRARRPTGPRRRARSSVPSVARRRAASTCAGVGDHRAPAARLDEALRRLDLRAHAAGRELAVGEARAARRTP